MIESEDHAAALPGTLDLSSTASLHEVLRARTVAGELRLDAQAVERVSTPGLQLLAAAAASACTKGIAFRLQHAPPVLRDAIVDLGLTAAIPVEG